MWNRSDILLKHKDGSCLLYTSLKETNFETGQSKDFVEEESGVTLEEAFLKDVYKRQDHKIYGGAGLWTAGSGQ